MYKSGLKHLRVIVSLMHLISLVQPIIDRQSRALKLPKIYVLTKLYSLTDIKH